MLLGNKFGWQMPGVKVRLPLLINHQIAAPAFFFVFRDVFQQLDIAAVKRQLAVKLLRHQGFLNKQAAGGRRFNAGKVYPLARIHNQAIQGALLKGHHLPALLFPVRFKVLVFEQRPGDFFQPLRLNAGHGAGK